jgi:aryl-alcohol dehydrogenase-like predicted oxidoreductase
MHAMKHQFPRRQFLQRSAVGLGGLALGSSLLGAETPPTFNPYERVPLGKTGLSVSRLCLGTGMRGGQRQSNQTRLGRENFQGLIRAAYDRGIRLFDLADLYGSHPYLLPALQGVKREDFVIITKIWWGHGGIPEPERPDADVVVQRFLKEIGTDYLDVVLLHCVTSAKWPEELRKQMDALAALKQKRVIRAHGVSVHSLPALEAAAAEPWVDSVNTRINPFGMSMDGPADTVVPVLKKLHAAGKGVVGMKIVGEGRLRNDPAKRAESVRFVLGLGCVDTLNVGFESTAEIDDLAGMVRQVPRPG